MTGTSDSTHLRLPVAVRVAALLYLFFGVAFGASVPLVLAYLERNGELPMTFCFRSMAGPFEQLGPETFTALGWTFVAVCAADVVAGVGLWRGRRWGARLGMIPFFSVMIPLFYNLRDYGLLDTPPAVILRSIAGAGGTGLPLGIFLMRAFFLDVPDEFADAARVDGCDELGVFRRS